MATKRKETAAEVCKERITDAFVLTDLIEEQLRGFQKGYFDQGEATWPVAGDLGNLRSKLIEAVMTICPFTEKEVEEILAELRD